MGFLGSFIRGGVLVAIALINIPTAKSALIIDAFDEFQQVRVQPTLGVNTVTSNVNGPGVLGNNRKTGPGQKIGATITYDGSGAEDVETNSFQGTPNTFYLDEVIGSAPANLEINGYAFRSTILSDQSFPLIIQVWDSTGSRFVSRTFTVPIGTESVIIPFSSFVGAMASENVSNQVGGLTLSLGTPEPALFGGANGTGAETSFFAIFNNPEPGTMAIAGVALVRLAAYRRKRRTA